MYKYSVIGLGKLGASMAAAIASRGHEVIGVDVLSQSVDRLNAGHAPVDETDLEQTIQQHRSRLRGTMDVAEAVAGSDVTFVVVPTPSEPSGAFSLKFAKQAFREIGRALAAKDAYHLVVMSSTVLPGATREGLVPLLEQHSGKECGVHFGVCYSPEFIALGSVIRDFLNPDFTLVGQFDDTAGTMLEQAYDEIMENRPPCRRMSIENAELTKIAVNTFVTTKITFANMLANICERIPGGDVDVVTHALGLDRRIGAQYLKGALGYGGPCFPRDNVALSYIARQLGVSADLADATDRMNRSIARRVAKWLEAEIPASCRIGILGLAYKPFSHVVEESQGIALANELAKLGHQVLAYDPLAAASARSVVDSAVRVVDSMREVLREADLILVTTPDPEFSRINPADFAGRSPKPRVIDFWRILRSQLGSAQDIDYVPFGTGLDSERAAVTLRKLWGEPASSEPAGTP